MKSSFLSNPYSINQFDIVFIIGADLKMGLTTEEEDTGSLGQ